MVAAVTTSQGSQHLNQVAPATGTPAEAEPANETSSDYRSAYETDRFDGTQVHSGTSAEALCADSSCEVPQPSDDFPLMQYNPGVGQLSPVQTSAQTAAVVPGDVLDSGLELEKENEQLPSRSPNGVVRGYHIATPTRSEREQGATNCSTFVSDAVREAGYDTSRRIPYELPNGEIIEPTVDDWINNRAEEEGEKHRLEGEDFTPMLPEVSNPPPGSSAKAELKKLVSNNDPRIQGAPYALTQTGQARMVGTKEDGGWNNLRPGDVLQTWSSNGSGHSTVVHSVSGIDPRTNERVTIGPDTDPALYKDVELRAVQVEVLGSHLPKGKSLSDLRRDSDGVLEGDSVYVKNAGGSDTHYRWYAARPNGSDWAAQ